MKGAICLSLLCLIWGCSSSDQPQQAEPLNEAQQQELQTRQVLRLPPHFETPYVPDYNPISEAKITLGRHLFYDKRLSGNATQSCASCHHQERAFADDKVFPTGSTGEMHFRNSQSLVNVAWNASYTWAADGLVTLEKQIMVPLTGDRPTELGVHDGIQEDVFSRLEEDEEYRELFALAYPESSSDVTLEKIAFALASFCRSLVSSRSPYDRFLAGDREALTPSQRCGMSLFFGERLECFHCHNGAHLTTSYHDVNREERQLTFFNNGLYNVDQKGSYPAHDQGLYELTLDPRHRGLFRPPSLRNVAVTAPYMHDGSIATLRDVLVEHYAQGGTLRENGPFMGDGRLSPLKSGLIRGFVISDDEIQDVLMFLDALTDEHFLTDPAFADPFKK